MRAVFFTETFIGAALLLASASGMAAENLQGGDQLTLTLAEGEINRDYYIQVPEGATHLSVMLEAVNSPNQQDVDLALRYGEPFQTGDAFAQSLYYSAGSTGLEYLHLSYASNPPVTPGRWYLALYNYDDNAGSAKVTLTVDVRSEAEPSLKPLEIEIVYTDRNGFGFKSDNPFPGEGGNNAPTMGAARKKALEKAVSILEKSFTSPVPIIVEAHFEAADTGEGEGTPLASAGPTLFLADFPGAPLPDTWYAGSVVPRLAGTDFCRLTAIEIDGEIHTCKNFVSDIQITFYLDTTDDQWWYGLSEPQVGIDGYDFVSTAMHELIHGLGFLSLVNVETGAKFNGRDDIYSEQLIYRNNNGKERPFNELSKAQRRTAMTSPAGLFWGGVFAESWENPPTGRRPLVVYTPSTPNPGSSVSHVSFADIMYFKATTATREEVVTRKPGEALGAAWYFLPDIGWSTEAEPKLGDSEIPIHLGLYFDPARLGHGFDFQRSGPNYFLLFYTYDENGEPEWYLATMTEDSPNVFTGDLAHYTYNFADAPGGAVPQQATTVGSVTLDFTASLSSPACQDGVERDTNAQWVRFSWSINGTSGDWCVRPLPVGSDTNPDFTGSWFAGLADQGWGMSIAHGQGGNGELLVDTVYYYDAEGNPRWAQAVFSNFSNGQTATLLEYPGYARTAACNQGCDPGEPVNAGTLKLNLVQPSRDLDAGNEATVHVTYQGAEGGDWNRENAPIILLSDPVP